ncbi:hypothetical protein MKX01_022665 [Papaver californicum]|nr:hypothetical protein MKX01_022665 [Papaver californicum]
MKKLVVGMKKLVVEIMLVLVVVVVMMLVVVILPVIITYFTSATTDIITTRELNVQIPEDTELAALLQEGCIWRQARFCVRSLWVRGGDFGTIGCCWCWPYMRLQNIRFIRRANLYQCRHIIKPSMILTRSLIILKVLLSGGGCRNTSVDGCRSSITRLTV